jgi:hypothetical protein
MQGALFGRADVARLLNIPEWTLANFIDRRYRYGLTPSVRGGKGRGRKGFYTLADVYKVAVAYRLFIADQDTSVIAETLAVLFPADKDPMQVAVKHRARSEAEARQIVIEFSGTFITGLPDDSISVSPEEWRPKNLPADRPKITLRPRKVIAKEAKAGTLRAFLVMPFDELLNWVDSRILGREVTFTQPGTLGGSN